LVERINCRECIKKQEEIYRLKEELKNLKVTLRIQQRQITEGYFGSSTPSSKKPYKENSKKGEKEKNRGGAKHGHKGNGRQRIERADADRIEQIKASGSCPQCGGRDLEDLGMRDRAVVDYTIKTEKVIYQLERKRCKGCKHLFQAKAPGVLPKNLYSNNLLAHVASEHYLNGIPLGHLERGTGVGYGALIGAMQQLAGILKDIPELLIEDYRQSKVKHADETGWRNDGENGYAWLFTSKDTSIFRFRKSRSGKIAREVLGTEKLPGVLLVDRYDGYNKAPCNIQYCYAHLLRNMQDLEKEFPDNEEVKNFIQAAAPLLAEAMNLRSLPISDKEFYKRASKTKEEIIKIMNSEANHLGIQDFQNIFREKKDRLFHWAEDQEIPADNNFCERELRRLVVARKISFCSHSDKGQKTREILMSVLKTLKLQTKGNVRILLKNFLDKISVDPNINIYHALFSNQPD
jgi:hypothetical protein